MMKKLSELKSDDMLWIGEDEYGAVVAERDDFVADMDFYGNNPVFTTTKEVAQVSWGKILDLYEDEMFEDWYANLIDEASHNEELKKALTTIQHIFDINPTYYQGELVLIDMESED